MRKIIAFSLLSFFCLFQSGNTYSKYCTQSNKAVVKDNAIDNMAVEDINWRYHGFFIKL